jgi:uncharacterized protein YcaQ
VSAELSLAQARRIALGAQGLAAPRPSGAPTARRVRAVVDALGLVQIDSVNVLARMHYLPAFTRLGPYPRALLDELAWGPLRKRAFFEYWAHEASLIPLARQPLFRWRMARAERGLDTYARMAEFARERRAEADALLARIATDGPMAASDVGAGSGGWWGWSDAKIALEWLFWSGRLTTRTRRASFERVYDLTERVIPAAVLAQPTPSEADAHRTLLAEAARALGIATLGDLRDYVRLSPGDAAPRVAELVDAGDLVPVQVEGWKQAAYLHARARIPRAARAATLLAPFDPLIWERKRTERLFGIRYRIEIYVPANKREHGYFVLPFLLGDRIVARVDLKADRAARELLVQAAHREPDAPLDVAEPLAHELRAMATWLDLQRVRVVGRNAFARALSCC